MTREINRRTKIISFVLLGIVILFLSILVYLYQIKWLNLQAESSITYSSLCIEGKINGTQGKKCFFNNESDKDTIRKENTKINLEVGENYKLYFTLGDYLLNLTEEDGMQPVHQKCQPIWNGIWGWDFKNCSSLCTTSRVFWLVVGLDTDVFSANFSNLSGQTKSVKTSVDDTKTLKSFHGSDLSGAIKLFGYASHKDNADINKYDPDLGKILAVCGPDNNKGQIIKYGGQHYPGDRVTVNFTPNIEYDGNIGGYNANGHKGSGDVYGYGIIVPISIKKSNANNNSFNDNTQTNNTDSTNTSSNNSSNNSNNNSSNNSNSQKTAVPIADNTKNASEIENNNTDTVNIASSDSSDSSASNNSDTNNQNDKLAIKNITSLVSTGASLWFNVLIAVMIIIGLGYFFFREDIFKQ